MVEVISKSDLPVNGEKPPLNESVNSSTLNSTSTPVQTNEVSNSASQQFSPSAGANLTSSPVNPLVRRPSVIVSEGGASGKKIFVGTVLPLLLIVLTILIMIMFFYFFYRNDLIVLHEADLIAGENISLDVGQEVTLNLEEGELLIKILEAGEGSSRIKTGGGEEVSVNVDQEVMFDVNGDGVNDLILKLIRRQNGDFGYIFLSIKGREKKIEAQRRLNNSQVANNTVNASLGVGCEVNGAISCEGENSYCPSGIMVLSGGERCCNSVCYDKTKTCLALGGVVKTSSNGCLGHITKASDTDYCCVTKELDVNICEQSNIRCTAEQKCGRLSGDGTIGCVFKTCEDYGFKVCEADEYCEGDFKIVGDMANVNSDRYCCKTECINKTKVCESKNLSYCLDEGLCVGLKSNLLDISEREFYCCDSCKDETVIVNNYGDLYFSSDSLTVSSSVSSILKGDCATNQYLFFNVYNSFETSISNVNARIYIDDSRYEDDLIYEGNLLLRTAGTNLAFNTELVPGKNEVLLPFDYRYFVSGKTVRIDIDYGDHILETNQLNNQLIYTFSENNPDFSFASEMDFDVLESIVLVDIKFNGLTSDCPVISVEDLVRVKINDLVVTNGLFFDGFNSGAENIFTLSIPVNTDVIGPDFSISVLLDPHNLFLESNENNNIVDGSFSYNS